jgi:2-keto-4-pentenoate hydratase
MFSIPRYESSKFTLSDVVSDNASAGAFYLGPIARRPAISVTSGCWAAMYWSEATSP